MMGGTAAPLTLGPSIFGGEGQRLHNPTTCPMPFHRRGVALARCCPGNARGVPDTADAQATVLHAPRLGFQPCRNFLHILQKHALPPVKAVTAAPTPATG
jgi:hypothetical protein